MIIRLCWIHYYPLCVRSQMWRSKCHLDRMKPTNLQWMQ